VQLLRKLSIEILCFFCCRAIREIFSHFLFPIFPAGPAALLLFCSELRLAPICA
jgi:hypothetical protein